MQGLVQICLVIGRCGGHVTTDLINDGLDSILCAVEPLGSIVLMYQRVLLDGDLPMMSCHHLCDLILLDLLLSR